MTNVVPPGQHARLSPSKAKAIRLCPGMLNATKDLPRRANKPGAEGTILHAITAECLSMGLEPYDYVGETWTHEGFSFVIDEDQAEAIVPGLDWVREQPGKVYVETRVDLTKWDPWEYGTLDVGIADVHLITIVDHKYGFVPVEAESNDQLMLYALGFWEQIARHETQATRFRLIINQPRRPGKKWLEWFVDLDELLAFGDEAIRFGLRAQDPDAERRAGLEQCQYCDLNPATGGRGCDALERFNLALFDQKFDDLDDAALLGVPPVLPDYSEMTPERRAFLWRHRHMLTNWIEGMTELSLADALAGEPPPGLKAVPTWGNREWTDEPTAEAVMTPVLGADTFNKKLKSPAQAEKVLKPTTRKPGHPEAWKRAASLIRRPEGKPELAEITDEREAITPVDAKFDED